MSERKPEEEDFKGKLLELQIETRNTRRKETRNILIIVGLAVVSLLIGYYYPQFGFIYGIGILVGFIGGLYIVFSAIPTFCQPLNREQRAFKKIVKAIEVLRTSDKPLAYDEAYNNVKDAYRILKEVELPEDIGWYKGVNRTFEQLLENLQLIVLPAIKDCLMKKKHLEKIALAIISMSQKKVKEVNKKLESKYDKAEPESSKATTFLTAIRKSTVGKILGSLALGYGLVLVICLLFVLGTNQDFIPFLKDQPTIVILGGLGASGITFWRAK